MHAFRWNWRNWYERYCRSPSEPRIRGIGFRFTRKEPATERLTRLGAKILIGHHESNIEGAEVVVVSKYGDLKNPEVTSALAARIPVIPRAQMLAELMRFKHGIAISGTHGKTTTTSLAASVLAEGGLDPTYIIGGKLQSSRHQCEFRCQRIHGGRG